MKYLLVLSFLFITSVSFAQDEFTVSRPTPGQGGSNPGRVGPSAPPITVYCDFDLVDLKTYEMVALIYHDKITAEGRIFHNEASSKILKLAGFDLDFIILRAGKNSNTDNHYYAQYKLFDGSEIIMDGAASVITYGGKFHLDIYNSAKGFKLNINCTEIEKTEQ